MVISGKQEAENFLAGSLHDRKSITDIEINTLLNARNTGWLPKSTTDADINQYADLVGYHHQATTIIQNPPSHGAMMTHLINQAQALRHPKGATGQ